MICGVAIILEIVGTYSGLFICFLLENGARRSGPDTLEMISSAPNTVKLGLPLCQLLDVCSIDYSWGVDFSFHQLCHELVARSKEPFL